MIYHPRILLADDHRIVAEGLRSLLADEFNVVEVVEDGRALIASAKKLRPDIIVSDIAMPHLNGIDAMVRLRQTMPRVKTIFLTMHQDVAYARRALEAGAVGFLFKHAAPTELLLAIRTALAGSIYITPQITGDLLQAMRFRPRGDEAAVALTPRQREVLQLVVEGHSAKEIASNLVISTRTVEFHKSQMMESLGLHNSAELILFAVKHQLVAV